MAKIEWNKVTWYSKLAAVILFIFVAVGGFYLGAIYEKANIYANFGEKNGNINNRGNNDGGNEGEKIFCTMEAKLCSDGSYVGRSGPNCEFALCPSTNNSSGTIESGKGIIEGRINIGPLCPVEPCSVSMPNPYESRKIILKPQFGNKTDLYIKINSDGTFRDEVLAGAYEIAVSDCNFLGCRYALPKTAEVKKDKATTVDIDIDTGIR